MTERLKFYITTLILVESCVIAQDAVAIPSPLDHTHTSQTVHWQDTNSPSLPWTNTIANRWNHNHLTSDPFRNPPKFIINKAWDNRILHNSEVNGGPSQFGHGMILSGSAVRYGFTNNVPNEAKDVVEAGFNNWITKATEQYNLYKDPWDFLAIDFKKATDNNFEVTIDFDDDVAGSAYGAFDGVNNLTFRENPNPSFNFTSLNEILNLGVADPRGWMMRFNEGEWKNVLNYQAPWSFDGTPNVVFPNKDIDFQNPAGEFFESLNGVDAVNLTEMDFTTIALHEIGHVIALGHPGDPTSSIMRTNIFRNAIFSKTMQQIDNQSALGVAIVYTYAEIPEPTPTLGLLALGTLGAASTLKRKLKPSKRLS